MSRFDPPTEIPPGGVMLEGTPYRLLSVLGSGGQGIAYKVANNAAGGRYECLKILLNVRERELVERFLRERDTLGVLKHKAIVHMIASFWLPDGRPAFTMEFVDGLSVKELLRGGRPLSVRQAVGIASDVADGLAAAHAKGFVHRDIKPANLIVAHDGAVKIIDFGVAKVLQVDPNSPEEKLTINPGLIGTMVYASPEMLWRFVATPESDLYSLGLVLYEMLTGRRPFQAKSAVELAELVRTTPAPSLAAAGHGGPFPDQLDWIVRSLLKSNVEERTRTAREARRQLEGIKRLLPNDTQIEVNADAGADDITVASTAVGSYPDAIAATGPAPAVFPIVRTSSPNFPSSIPTAPSPAPVHDDRTVRSEAFVRSGERRGPDSDAVETFRESPRARSSSRPPRAGSTVVRLIAAVLLIGGVGAFVLARSGRKQINPTMPEGAGPPVASVASSTSWAYASSSSSASTVVPKPSGVTPVPLQSAIAGAPTGAQHSTATKALSGASAATSAKAALSAASPTSPSKASAAAPPTSATQPPKPPPTSGAMDDRL